MIEVEPDVLVTNRRRSRRRIVAPKKALTTPEHTFLEEEEEHVPEVTDRRKQDRRRQIDPTTCERDYSGSEVEFMRAMDNYKRKSGRPFPTWSEVLEVLTSLGYRKVAEPTTMQWRSSGD
ncbi:MAG: hypothetical protein GY758_10115 [Fuerstiella sp.]|jgi:hypothetical protein|nr:hypothetical protein [Fuerstiella sp.]MDG2128487.1 hypothetical protein [Fuerstiella sp.]